MNIIEDLRALYSHFGYKWDEDLNVLGIRDAADLKKDVFNDRIGAVVGDEVKFIVATVDPGLYYTNPKNRPSTWPTGCAHLVEGQYTYRPHIYRNTPAFAPSSKLRFWRDVDGDMEQDHNEKTKEAWADLFFHQPFRGNRDYIGGTSAGCQCGKNPESFQLWHKFIMSAARFKSNPKADFNYALFDRGQLPPALVEEIFTAYTVVGD